MDGAGHPGPWQGQEGGIELLCVAHLSPRKGQMDLVKALAGLGAGGWTCQLVGSLERDLDYAHRVQSQVEALGLTGCVRLVGELSGLQLERAFARANLFVLPSHYEGYGMVIDEALAHGLPVISSDGGALAVTASRPGCVTYPAGDSEALARLIGERIEDLALLQDQQAAARQSGSALRSWRQCAQEFDQALLDISAGLPEGSEFAEDWLRLREPADHQARDPGLCEQAATWLGKQSNDFLVVVDIGSGSGSNWRYLREAFPPALVDRCQWHLYDQDQALLNAGTLEEPSTTLHPVRLEADDLDRLLPAPLHLLTASALIDLVSTPWLEAFAKAASERSAAVLVVLSYAGRFRLSPTHPYDDSLIALVNDHQHRDKGTGASCGPEASEVLAAALAEQGYQVRLAPSVWRLGRASQALQIALIEGWIGAARSQIKLSCRDGTAGYQCLEQWLNTRVEQARAGELFIEVDHVDLFGVPGA
nr:glycosyltransferase [Marinobacter bryozoorum]